MGTEIVGAAIGGAIGLIGGPAGAIGGGVAGVLVSKSLGEVAERFLSNREQARVGAVAGLSIIGIQENLERGFQLRDDNFFERNDINRSKAEELFEGILLKCKDEYEEKKILFIANIYKNISFDVNINPDNANQILNLVHQISYRQLCILALVGQNINNKFSLRYVDYDDSDIISKEKSFLLQDFVQLERQGLIHRKDNFAILDNSSVTPGIMVLTPIGQDYFYLLSLDKMLDTEFSFIEILKD